ncbi:MAG: hypothetical protein ACRDYW_13015 [Acidimicrobiales bacterium]
MIRRITITIGAGAFLLASIVGTTAANAAPLPDGCTKDRGTVTCTTFDGPGNNQGGVGETTVSEGQGNPDNTSPEPQDLDSSQTCKPPSSQGRPCNP